MDKRRAWREQERELVARWNAAAERHRQVHEELQRRQPLADGPSEELRLREQAVRAEIEALRRQVARIKAEFNSGKRY
jgi:polyhydroxyalkanoate synthesis regulator phasin